MLQAEHSIEKPAAGNGAIICLSLSMLLASLGTSIANIALPALALAFDAPVHRIQWVIVAYLLTLTLFALVAGRLGDLYGRRRMLAAGLALFSLASLLCGLAGGLWFLIAARALQGVGAAFLMVLTIALVRDTCGSTGTGRIMGLLGTMSALGTALGPALGGLLIAAGGWQAVFLVPVPVGLLAAALVYRLLPPDRPGPGTPAPLLRAVHTSGFIRRLSANFLVATVMMTTLIVGPFYLAFALNLPAAMVGLVMSIGPVLSILTGIPSGRLVDFAGAHRMSVVGLIALSAGALALAILPGSLGLAGYIAALVLLTPGYQLFQAANNTLVMADAREDQRGVISGWLGLSRNLGLVAGASLMAAVFSYRVGVGAMEDATSSAILSGMQLVFSLAGVLILAALLITQTRSGRE